MDKNGNSANGGAKSPKSSTNTDPEPSSKWCLPKERSDEIGPSGISKTNSTGGEKEANTETRKGKKRKLFSLEDGSKKASKRRLHGVDTEHSEEAVAKDSGELPSFNLPGELLVKIIDKVPTSQWASLEMVSHSFQEVVNGLWGQLHEIRLDELVYNKEKKPYQVVEAVLKKFLIRAPNVASISGFGEFFGQGKIRLTEFGLPKIRLLSKFEHLQTINFSGGRVVKARNFAAFLESSASRQSWKSLNIVDGIHGTMKSNKEGGSKNQPALNLEYFKFNTQTIGIFDRFLQVDWSRLKKLVIIGNSMSAKELLSIIRQCSQVGHLNLVVPDCQFDEPSYDEFMEAVAALENLSVLKISTCSSWAPFRDALLVLFQGLARRGRMAEFALLVSGICNDQILGAIIDYLPRLKSLDLHVGNCKTSSLERMANEMSQLETLKLRSNYNINKADGAIIRAIVANISGLQCLHLEYQFENYEEATNLVDLRKLKELRIIQRTVGSGMQIPVGSRTVESWAHRGFGRCLETLELLVPLDINPEVMACLFKNMPRLRSMKLSGGVTDGILDAIAQFCPSLVELELLESSTITSTPIQSVIDRCSQLKSLKVFGDYGWFPEALAVGKYRKITFMSFGRIVITNR